MPKNNQQIAKAVVAEILGPNGLEESTWRHVYPGAYDNLKLMTGDLEGSVLKVLDKS